ncbi:TPR domain protein [Minicystis rosea]|nr:TPR domain protein [Minicystis rosea]
MTVDEVALPFLRDALGGTMVFEEHKGSFTKARILAEEALADARTGADPARLADALLARAQVHLLQGEPRAASARLGEIATAVPDDVDRAVRALSYTAVADALNRELFPGRALISAADLRYGFDDSAFMNRVTIPYAQLSSRASVMVRRECAFVDQVLRRGLPWSAALAVANPARLAPEMVLSVGEFTSQAQVALSGWGPRLRAYECVVRTTLLRSDGEAAAKILERARELYAACDDRAGLALVQMTRGDWAAAPLSSPLLFNTHARILVVPERFEGRAAVDAYAEAERLFAEAGAPRGLAAITLRRSCLAGLRGDHAGAMELARAAAQAFDDEGDRMSALLARAHQAIAGVGAGNPVSPRDLAASIGTWARDEGSRSFAHGVGDLFCQIGYRWLSQGDFERAMACTALATTLFEALGARAGIAETLVWGARIHRMIGDGPARIVLVDRALDALDGIRDTPAVTAETQTTLATALSAELGETHDAARLERLAVRMRRVVETCRPIGSMPEEPADMAMSSAKALALGAIEIAETGAAHADLRALEVRLAAAMDEGDAAATADLARRAFDIMERPTAQSFAPYHKPDLLWELGRKSEAVEAARQLLARWLTQAKANDDASAQLAPSGAPAMLASQRVAWAWALSQFVRFGQYAEANDHFERLRTQVGEEWWRTEPAPTEALAAVAEMHRGLGDAKTALATYDLAIAEMERMHGALVQDRLKLSLAARMGVHIHAPAARVALELADRAQDSARRRALEARAFAYVEKGAARALLDLVAASGRHADGGGGDSVRAYRDAATRVTLAQSLLAAEREKPAADAGAVEALGARLAAAERALRAVEGRLADEHPAFSTWVDPGGSILSLDEVRMALPEGAVLLQYTLHDEGVMAWAVSREGMTARHDARLDVRALSRSIRDHGAACAGRGPVSVLGEEIARVLLEPLREAIAASDALFIVPSGAALALAFHALPFASGEPLGADRSVVHLPSASMIRIAVPPRALDAVVAIGNPAEMACRAESDGVVRPLPPLPGPSARLVTLLGCSGSAGRC